MILTNLHRLMDAIRFKVANGASTFLIFGGLVPWDNDTSPPLPVPTTTSIPDAFAAVPVTVRWVKEDDAGIYTILGSDNTVRSFSELTTQTDVLAWSGDIFVLLQGTLLDGSIDPSITAYRQLGFATNLVPTSGHGSDSYLPAANIADFGDLETLEYRRPYPVIVGSQHDFFEVIQY
jgi:hypothetical protein